MKGKHLGLLAALVVCIFVLGSVAAFGLTLGNFQILPVSKALKLGLDLRGGASVLLEAKDNPKDPVTKEKIERAIGTIRTRIDSIGVTEPSITASGDKRILVELPEIKDTQKALDLIGKTAQLQLLDEKNNVVITGSDIKTAKGVYIKSQNGMGTDQPVVSFTLTKEGATKFADATKANIGKQIRIVLDGEVISSPVVNSEIPDGEGVIEGSKDLEEASNLATLIRAGALPVELTTLQVTSVGPQLGANSLERTVYAGMIGVLIVFIFMIVLYRVPGVIADITLVLYLTLVLLVLAGFKATLTLPGIAGIILGVGMAVDANILIFERLKEELRTGKTLRAAMDAGFKRAFLTIFDSNLTTIIAAAVLFYFGSGTIKGFAVTLIVSILISMFTAITVTKYLLTTLISSGLIKNPKFYSR